ncbi:hypothetical protein C3729_12640 [Cloacibacterium normanense]|uniref:EpsG family protein n=1 Tax=Cloacibacterium normanense TaxID=237258 RepID=A0A2S7I254_9FLAO|nr:hypothetical protein [Cloacibacterium normanense]PPZ90575.1 hypothetical protein C3729_12640 [Cloacibacterium normanense]
MISAVSKIKKTQLFLFLINPFLLLFTSIRNFNRKNFFFPFFLVSIFFSYQFATQDISDAAEGEDAQRYKAYLHILHDYPVDFVSSILSAFSAEEGEADIYQFVVTYFVSIFTNDTKILFLFFGVIFSFFWLKNLEMILKNIGEEYFNKTLIVSLLIFLLFLINPIWQINGARFWTAAHVFSFIILKYFLEQNKRALFFLPFPILIHFSLILFVFFFILYKFLPKNKLFFLIIYILSIFFVELDISALNELFKSAIPLKFEDRFESYTNVEYIDNIKLQNSISSFHIKFHGIFQKYIMIFLTLFSFIKLYEEKIKSLDYRIVFFYFSVMLSSISNILAATYNFNRFLFASDFILLASILVLNLEVIPKAIFIRLPLKLMILFVIFVKIRFSLLHTSIWFYIGNPIVVSFIDNPVSFFEDLKSFFN